MIDPCDLTLNNTVGSGADVGGGCKGCAHPPPRPRPPEVTCGLMIQLAFCRKTMWFTGVEIVVHPLLKKS